MAHSGNLIAALGVKEEHVVYRWSVMRELPDDISALLLGIARHMAKVGFKGTVLIPYSSQPTE